MVRWIHVVNQDVFGPDEGFLRWFNVFHRTSREHVVEREVLLRPGQMWDDELVDETRRRLRIPCSPRWWSSPRWWRSGGPEEVDLLVVTRDIWSLARQLALRDPGGGADRAQPVTVGEQPARLPQAGGDRVRHGPRRLQHRPQYVDKNIAGTHLQLLSRVDGVFRRDDGEREGSRSYTSFGYPCGRSIASTAPAW
jgi:hypothetical protein